MFTLGLDHEYEYTLFLFKSQDLNEYSKIFYICLENVFVQGSCF